MTIAPLEHQPYPEPIWAGTVTDIGPSTLPPSEAPLTPEQWTANLFSITEQRQIVSAEQSTGPMERRLVLSPEVWEGDRPILYNGPLRPTDIGATATRRLVSLDNHTEEPQYSEPMKAYFTRLRETTGQQDLSDREIARRIAQSQAEVYQLNHAGRDLRTDSRDDTRNRNLLEITEIRTHGHRLAHLRQEMSSILEDREMRYTQAQYTTEKASPLDQATHPDVVTRLIPLLNFATVAYAEDFHPVLLDAKSATSVVNQAKDENIRVLLRPDATTADYCYALSIGMQGFTSPALRHGAATAIAEDLTGKSPYENPQHQVASELFRSLLAFGVTLNEATSNFSKIRDMRSASSTVNEHIFMDALSTRTGIDMKVFLQRLSGEETITATPRIVEQVNRLLGMLPKDIATADLRTAAHPTHPNRPAKPRHFLPNRSRRSVEKFLRENKADQDGIFLIALRDSLQAERQLARAKFPLLASLEPLVPLQLRRKVNDAPTTGSTVTRSNTAPTLLLSVRRRLMEERITADSTLVSTDV